MTDWEISTTIPPDWSTACDQSGALFHSGAWLALLEKSFGCDTRYIVNENLELSAAVSSFRAGPFRIGYLGFPVGGMVNAGALSSDLVAAISGGGGADLPMAIRIPVSGFGGAVDLDLPYEATAETAIADLQDWDLAKINKNRRRDVNKSMRSGLEIVDAQSAADSRRIFELYRRTLERKDGSLRYTERYFSELIELATRHPRLRILLALQDKTIAAFTVVALHGTTAYYLHGAFDWEMRDSLPSAVLLYQAIEWAKAEDCTVFNLMSSPSGQDSLIKYKERWGGETREHRTYTLPLKPSFRLFKLAERAYRAVR